MSVPTKLEVCNRIATGVCPACLVDLEPALRQHERVGMTLLHPDGARLCPVCATGWVEWTSAVTGERYYGQTGGTLGPRPERPEF